MRGFKMVELVISLAVVAIIASSALPSFSEQIRRSRTTAISSDLRGDLVYARSEATKRNLGVIACPASATSGGCAAGTDWSMGWIVCTDADNNLSCDPSTDEAPNPMRVRGAIPATHALTGPGAPIRFNGRGETAALQSFTLRGTWTGATPTTVRVEPSGLVRG